MSLANTFLTADWRSLHRDIQQPEASLPDGSVPTLGNICLHATLFKGTCDAFFAQEPASTLYAGCRLGRRPFVHMHASLETGTEPTM